ncbi:MAG: ABC transporter ATP-binding protein [Gemmatales bacterium]|nr:MAG: ABC transporter ATP-binding protein [Gemmatales bacterium]
MQSALQQRQAPDQPVIGSTPVLLFHQVSKWYGPVIGLNQVTLELRPGIMGLVGPNGAGKSTLMKLATGQLKPDIGSVQVHGINAWSADSRRFVGYCPDVDAFFEEMSGREFVTAMARLCGFRRSEAEERAQAVLQRVGMADRADRRIGGYSKGMRQRIKLAQALVHDPELFILDEPLSGIDPIGRQEMIALLHSLARQGKTLLVSSHELDALEKLTDHVAVMTHGRIAAVGTLSKIRAMLDDRPLSILIATSQPRRLAQALLSMSNVVGIEFIRDDSLIVRAIQAHRFFSKLNTLVLEEDFDIWHLETIDGSAQAILGYVLGKK